MVQNLRCSRPLCQVLPLDACQLMQVVLFLEHKTAANESRGQRQLPGPTSEINVQLLGLSFQTCVLLALILGQRTVEQ